ncbi:unnamed protein product [Pleuronectes platessa]|uniref:Uncharacterized protein n=1 Tax=Pleuronectes platessa TaxID=8262 RepID=A0A9N7YAC4_PLEPL|nr:unnamed protein product [Pleuronectes platessa]
MLVPAQSGNSFPGRWASGAVIKLHGPSQTRIQQSANHSFLSLFIPISHPSLPLSSPSLLAVSWGCKTEYANAMVSAGAGVSQRGQNRVSVDTQTHGVPAIQISVQHGPQQVAAQHKPIGLLAEYPDFSSGVRTGETAPCQSVAGEKPRFL